MDILNDGSAVTIDGCSDGAVLAIISALAGNETWAACRADGAASPAPPSGNGTVIDC